ncbi:MAG: MT-A70 family methyltransferase [Rhodospirillaceae bacterium]
MTVLDLRPRDWPFGDLLPGRYSVILADPPWRFALHSAAGEDKSPQAHYSCMESAAIRSLPVGELAAAHCLLWMWATAPLLPEAIEVMRAWGFTYKTMGTWGKLSKLGTAAAFGTGYILRSVRNLILAPIREHSRKPEQQYHDIDELIPGGDRCELFARACRPGWDVWGNQTDRFAPTPDHTVTTATEETDHAA